MAIIRICVFFVICTQRSGHIAWFLFKANYIIGIRLLYVFSWAMNMLSTQMGLDLFKKSSVMTWCQKAKRQSHILKYKSYPHHSIVGTTLTNVFSILHQKIAVLRYRSGARCLYGHGSFESLQYILLIHWSVQSSATFFINYFFKDPK